ncbi:outer membrane beta-barrel protein [Mesorhizobium sp. YIM 152430]|uniref:outer membrane beta-barrel protein n=1 Tax=Mesorhizobium sp. YIM 152430 TaxID=3031761 RepID=UPI0023DB9D07|nr:outer membrane beta-barrel protein [Mesorhizobium sp. YIM 152430]MDF1601712.1 outer membrane beta-barrel protein [Mesorhizobium sp. YIM 152430]
MADTSFRLRRLAAAFALAGAAGALFASHQVLAQQSQLPLRGDLREDPARDLLLGRPLAERSVLDDESARAQEAYRPFSDGALSEGEPLAGQRRRTDRPVAEATPDPFAGTPPIEISERQRRAGPAGRENEPDGTALRVDAEGALDDTVTATVPLAAVDALDLERNLRVGSDASRINSIETARRLPDDNPYASIGLRVGTFELFPSIEQGIGATSNANGGADGESAVFSETIARFDLRSDWSRHEARLNGFGIVRRDLSGAEIRDTEAGLDGELRLDFAGGYEGRAALSYLHRPESASSPVSLASAASRPDRQTLAGELGIGREVARLRLGLAANVTRDMFSDARLSDGTTFSQEDRNSTLASLRLRSGYEVSPALIPFVEVEIGRRVYDNEIDAAGFARSADRLALRGGIGIDIAEKWRGEVYAGWLSENPDDDALDAVSGLEIGGNLAWSPLRGTTVDLNALTSVEGTTVPGASGSLLYAGNLSLTRELRANLTGTAGIGLDYRDYANSSAYDMTWSGQVALTWWLNRYLGLTGRARYETVTSSDAGRESDTASVFVGVRAQR